MTVPKPPRSASRRRDRVLPWVSLVVAALGAWQAHHWADEVRRINSERFMFGLMAAAMTPKTYPPPERESRPPALLPGLRLPPISQPATAPTDEGPDPEHPPVSIPELQRATAYTEAVVHLWERSLFLVAGCVGLIGILALLTRWKRLLHLIAAALILASTLATLIGLSLLVDPQRGALPPLPPRLYFYVGVVQSAYAWVLVIAYARPRIS